MNFYFRFLILLIPTTMFLLDFDKQFGIQDLLPKTTTNLINSIDFFSQKLHAYLGFLRYIGFQNPFSKVVYFIVGLLILILLATNYIIYKRGKKKILIEREIAEGEIKLKLLEIETLQSQKDKLEKLNLLMNTRLHHKIDLIEDISNNLDADNNEKVSHIIENSTIADKKFDETEKALASVHHSFYDHLIQLSDDELTGVDLKYCTYIYLNYDTAEISANFNVTRKSVRMAKYRIKKKLRLDPEVDLTDFLRNLKY